MGRRRPRPPLPQREGLDAVRVRTPARVGDQPAAWATLDAFLRDRLPARVPVDAWLAAGRFVDAAGHPIAPGTPYAPATTLWFHKDPPTDPLPPDLDVLFRDDRIVVVDKPHFLATIPRGEHVNASALVALRRQLGLQDLAPAHRLDRLTAGVLLFTIRPEHRAAYQALFATRTASKTYEALAPALPDLTTPTQVTSHIVKRRGSLQAEEVPDAEPNACTWVRLDAVRDGIGRYRLEPTTGRTHQLRVHLNGLGAPIVGDPLYPIVRAADDDPTDPLRLVARTLAFTDPIDGSAREFTSRAPLDWP
ncbi:MAG: pseudouridine synthase [Propionibacteriaceae bacterium]|nr:pseudouridine synthase [Propionibacteriaceae bacterium]